MPAIRTYSYIGFLLYLVYVVYVGSLGARKIKRLTDFAIAGETLGPIPVGLAFTASFFSAATFLGYVGYSYAWGQVSLWIFIAIFGGSTLGLIVLAKGVRERNIALRAASLPDWLGEAYQSDLLRGVVVIILLFQVFYVAGQLSAGGTLFKGLFGWDYRLGVVVTMAITVAYVTVGGLFADVYTSIGQTLIMMFAGVSVFLTGVFMFKGGLTEVSARLAAQNPDFISLVNPKSLHMYSWLPILGVILVEFAFSGQPQLLTKLLALRDPKDMSKMIWTWIVSAFCCMLIMFGGFYMRVLDPTLKVPDNAVVEFVARHMHPLFSVITSIAILAALMSTACGLLIVLATGIANDLYLKILAKRRCLAVANDEAAQRNALMLTRILPTVFGLICTALALKPPPFMAVMVWVGISGVASGTLAPMLMALFAPRRATTPGAIGGAIGGTLVFLILFSLTKIERSVMAAGAWGVAASFIIMYVVSLALPSSSREGKPAPGPATGA